LREQRPRALVLLARGCYVALAAMERAPQSLRIYRSNRMEKLAEALGDVLSEAPENALSPECILVPGRGVAQWLSMQLCQRFGVWANVLYLYPRNFVGWALDRVLAKPGEAVDSIDPERLLWSIFSALGPLLVQPEFETIRRYVEGDPTQVRYFELCRRIAYTFDRYATYRPDMLQSWERRRASEAAKDDRPQLALFAPSDEAQGWQPALWRALIERLGPVHTGALERRFLRSLQQAKRVQNLPARISCLGVTHLPPSYTRILVALCPHVPVHMFQLCASEQPDEFPLSAGQPQPNLRAQPPPRARDMRGSHPLFQSLGSLASEFESVLAQELSAQGVSTRTTALFEPPPGPSRLQSLQRELLERRPAPVTLDARAVSTNAQDDSIRIHVCHSPMREVEVLHDQLLDLMSRDTSLMPREIVVMMPEVEVYAPLIEAVFRKRSDETQRIPYSLADRSLQASAPVVDAIQRLFSLADQRLSATQVLDLLALDVVAARFEITAQDLEQITYFLTSTNVRWGMDADHREAHGHPHSDANSWRLGLRRLFLGYAIETAEPTLVFDALPAAGIEGTEAVALGKLALFIETLFTHVAALGQPHSPSVWPESVGAALDALCQHDVDTAWQHQEMRATLTSLAARASAAGYDSPITGPAYAELLFDALNSGGAARGFLMGGVTFCSMVPLRTIPFRVVCLLGLGDGQFPRQELSTDFDLISHGPEGRRLGDRSRRSEDRYVFLEAILSARERLIITYTGQSIRDNASIPPSVLVNELCDYLAAPALTGPAREEVLRAFVVRHPLQAFSPRYFDASDERLFSYADHYVEGARARGLSAATPPEFFGVALPAPPPNHELGVAELVRFYQNPTACLLNRRLELFLRERDLDVPDREPQELTPLDKYAAGRELLELLLRGVPEQDAKRLILATGALPLGAPGELDFLDIAASASAIAERVLQARSAVRRPALAIDQRLPGGRQLFGNLTDSFGPGLLDYQFSRVHAKHLLGLWIRHLLYCWQGPDGPRAQSALIGRPLDGQGVWLQQFRAVVDPATHLDALVTRFDQGQTLPLWFFPSTSLAYAEEVLRGRSKPGGAKSSDELKNKLQRQWQTEVERDPHLSRVYGNAQLLSELRSPAGERPAFEELALDIFEPLLAHLISDPAA
jgi:exodeoxyribonuclease V gamma subunit